MRMQVRAVALVALVMWSYSRPCAAWPWSKTVKVWEDDAKTHKIKVPKLDPDAIAKQSKFRLKLGVSFQGVGVGMGWARERGIQYDEQAQKLVDRLKKLAIDFNKGKLTLETYRRRLREIHAAEEKSRAVRNMLFLAQKQASQRAFVQLNKVLGLPADYIKQSKVTVDKAMQAFAAAANAVKVEARAMAAMPPMPKQTAQATWEEQQRAIQQATDQLLNDFGATVTSTASIQEGERIKIWADDARTRRIVVYKLDVDQGVKDITESLSLGATFLGFNVGPKAKWSLRAAKKYDENAQMIIAKYRQLCMEYNADLVSQESYLRRLRELYAAEDLASTARHEMFLLMRKQAEEGYNDLDSVLAKKGMAGGDAAIIKDLQNDMNGMSKKAWKGEKPKESTLSKMDAPNAAKVQATLTELEAKARGIKVKKPKDTIQVWATEAKQRKLTVPKLDPRLIADNVKRALSFRVTYYSFGPELTWAKGKGLEYSHYAQMLIIKYKQLCMDYNAGLVSQEAYQQRRQEIDAAIARARKVREEMFVFMRMLAKEAFDELDGQVDMLERMRPKF